MQSMHGRPVRLAVALLHRETAAALQEPDLREALSSRGADPVGSAPAAFDALIRADAAKRGRVIEEAGIPKT